MCFLLGTVMKSILKIEVRACIILLCGSRKISLAVIKSFVHCCFCEKYFLCVILFVSLILRQLLFLQSIEFHNDTSWLH